MGTELKTATAEVKCANFGVQKFLKLVKTFSKYGIHSGNCLEHEEGCDGALEKIFV